VGKSSSLLSPELVEDLKQRWKEVVLPATGAEDYESLRMSLSWYQRQKRQANGT
jgi:hypothetical protein